MIIDRTKHKTEKKQEEIRKFKQEWSDIESDIFLLKRKLEKLKARFKNKHCKLKRGDKVELFYLDNERNFVSRGEFYFDRIKSVNRDGEMTFIFRNILKDGSIGKREVFKHFAKLKKIE